MRTLLVLAAVGLFASCSKTSEYKIEGTANPDMDGKFIYLQTMNDAAEYVSLDSITVTNGKFEFKGITAEPQLARITFNVRDIAPLTFILENSPIKATVSAENTVSGTPANDSLQAYYGHVNMMAKDMQAIVAEYRSQKEAGTLTPEQEEALMGRYDAIDSTLSSFDQSFIKANTNSLAGTFVLARSMSTMTGEEVEQVLSSASPAFKATPLMGRINEFVAAAKRSAIGAEFTNLTMSDLAGQQISLSDYIGKGKYVLVDFWASWCGPCRREMPVVVEAYKKYAAKGFEIVGVSFDNNKEAWEKGVQDLGMTWPQMSDLKGWQCEASSVYGIRSIPATLLFDPQGKIIAKNLRGEELDATLAEYLK